MEALEKILEIKWPDNAMQIQAFVTLNPICPRYIKKRSFDIFYQSKKPIEVTIHEILHFIYFEKWKQVFPETNEKEFDAPYLVWDLSEMVASIILKDKKIQDIFKFTPSSYKEHENLIINGKPILDSIQGIYNNKTNFEDFLRKSWKFVKDNEEEIKNKLGMFK